MIQAIRTPPSRLYVGISGGVDSVVLAHFLAGKCDVTLVFINHGDALASQEEVFVTTFAWEMNLPLMYFSPKSDKTSTSKEKTWRDMRYSVYHSLDGPVAVGHNLNDAAEWYLMTCLRGEGHWMEYSNKNVIRPLLTAHKADILEYAFKHELEWFDDPTNYNVDWTSRNKVRHEILPKCLEVNPGFLNTVKRNIIRKTNENN